MRFLIVIVFIFFKIAESHAQTNKELCLVDCNPINIWEYKKGMQFHFPATPSLLATNPVYPGFRFFSKSYPGQVQYQHLAGKTFVLIKDPEFTEAKSYPGGQHWQYKYTFRDEASRDTLVYRAILDKSTFGPAGPQLPLANNYVMQGAIYLPELQEAQKQLTGKTVYTVSAFRGKRFEPVTITKVGYGTWETPLRIHFQSKEGAADSVDVNICGTNVRGSLVSDFHILKFFAYSTPQKSLGADDATWSLIRQGKIKSGIGMTPEQVELALGKPQKTKKPIIEGDTSLEYFYADHHLFFSNGKLVKIE